MRGRSPENKGSVMTTSPMEKTVFLNVILSVGAKENVNQVVLILILLRL
jgi:hypothetical protein